MAVAAWSLGISCALDGDRVAPEPGGELLGGQPVPDGYRWDSRRVEVMEDLGCDQYRFGEPGPWYASTSPLRVPMTIRCDRALPR